jgi:hypothetical protein
MHAMDAAGIDSDMAWQNAGVIKDAEVEDDGYARPMTGKDACKNCAIPLIFYKRGVRRRRCPECRRQGRGPLRRAARQVRFVLFLLLLGTLSAVVTHLLHG